MQKGSIGLGLAAIGLIVVIAFTHPKARWRIDTLVLKLRGELPEYSLSRVLAAQVPTNWSSEKIPSLTGGLVTGRVVYSRRELSGPCPVVFDTPLGEVHGRVVDDDLLENLVREQLDDEIYRHPEAHVSDGDVVVDGGAHLGTFVLDALRSGARLVVAFEPEPTNADCLRRTLREEIEQGRVILKQAALWHTPGQLRFEVETGEHESARGKVAADGVVEVEAVTLDDVIDELGLDSVDFIKMDIEGAERDALAGSERTLKRFAPKMALCVYHRDDDPKVVPEVVYGIRPDYRSSRTDVQVYFYP